MADQGSPQVECRKPTQRNRSLERCCDIIATEILMPGDIFYAAADRCGWSLRAIRSLASTFQVTVQAAARRLMELIKEPALLSLWRPQANQPLQALNLSWSIPNALGKALNPQVRWQTGPQAMLPLYQALNATGVTTGGSKVLTKIGGESRYRWVLTEAMAVGRGDKQSLLGFHYLSKPSSLAPRKYW